MPRSIPHGPRYASSRRDTATVSDYSLRSLYLQGRSYLDRTYQAFVSLPHEQRYIIYFAVAVKLVILGVVFYIGPEAIFDATAKLAIWFGAQPYGAILLIALVILVSFPPLIGYGTSITLCGLGWGVHAQATNDHPELNGNLFQAWLLASVSCLLGAAVSFTVLRFLIVHHSKRVSWISNTLNDAKYIALSTAVRRRSLSMAILIRFCPFPFAYSNLFFASLVDAVSFHHFLAATALITPKLFLHVWLGTRMFQLMDRDERAHLSGWAKILNVVYIVIGSAIGVATGWIVWNETNKVLEAIQAEQRQGGQQSERRESATAERPYRDTPLRAETSPFVLDYDDDDDEVEEQVAKAQKGKQGNKRDESLLPR